MSVNTLGRYKIIREIARSNDVVYEAVDASINRRIALKELLLPPNLTAVQMKERIDRFYREARAAGSLSHPNIVTIFEAGEDNGRHFIAMEYLEGQTLRKVLETDGRLSEKRAVGIAHQVCDALAYAHAHNVIHRDIKPENIQILPSGHVKITDFGIARIMEEPTLTADGQVFGTPSYMSPEQIAGKPLDNRTDIFSLGIVIFEMLSGRKPFIGDSVVTITYNIMNLEVIIPPGLPPNLEKIIRISLNKDPNMRYRTATEMLGDLEDDRPYAYAPAPAPDPYGVTTQSPAPYYPQPPARPVPPPQPSYPSVPDPFANLKPGDLSLPRHPSKPLLSNDAKYFLKIMLGVLVVVGIIIFFVWALTAGYQNYQQQTWGTGGGGRHGGGNQHLDLAQNYYQSQSYQAAIQEFILALDTVKDPKQQAIIKHDIAVCYVELGEKSRTTGKLDEAMALWQQALEYEPHNDDALDGIAYIYLARGNQFAQSGDLNSAMQWWKKATEISPGTPSGQQALNNMRQYMNN